jgi:hypothetical protein
MEVQEMGGPMNNHLITIDVCDQECVVAPMELIAHVGDLVTFDNLTEGRVIVFFPNQEIFGQHSYEINFGGKTTLTVGAVDFGSYPFTVFCERTDGFLNKAARPRIIVVRK